MQLITDSYLKELSDRYCCLDSEIPYLIRILKDIRKNQDVELSQKTKLILEEFDAAISLLLLRHVDAG